MQRKNDLNVDPHASLRIVGDRTLRSAGADGGRQRRGGSEVDFLGLSLL